MPHTAISQRVSIRGIADELETLFSSRTTESEPRHFSEVIRLTEQTPNGLVQNLVIASYQKGEDLVHDGKMVSKNLGTNFTYSHVPLGFILRGKINVIKGAKATKQLYPGDFIGLFETSDWLLTEKNRQIGDWTLVANDNAEVLFFSDEFLRGDTESLRSFRDYVIELARHDAVPQPITTLPMLDWVASHTTNGRLADCVIIAHTHLLPNNLPLFRHLSYLVDFGRMVILEKPYSTVRSTLNDCIHSGIDVIPVHVETGFPYEFAVQKSLTVLWRKVTELIKKTNIKKILILDDGGDIWFSIPWHDLKRVRIAGVEQTQRGITRIANSTAQLPPIVSVASSGIKKIVEPEFIGLSVANKLVVLGVLPKKGRVGIIGMGSIGRAIHSALLTMDYDVITYDIDRADSSSNTRGSLDALINDSELIVSTTGTDALKGIALERISGNKTLVSASSADVEFSSLLRLAFPVTSPFDTVQVRIHDKCTLKILNGGYPINFDREQNATPDEDIVLTRSLLYIGMMQANALLDIKNPKPGIYALEQESQRKVLTKWLEEKQKSGTSSAITQKDIERIITFTVSEIQYIMPSVWKE